MQVNGVKDNWNYGEITSKNNNNQTGKLCFPLKKKKNPITTQLLLSSRCWLTNWNILLKNNGRLFVIQKKQKYFLKNKEILVNSYFKMPNIYNVMFSKSWINGIAFLRPSQKDRGKVKESKKKKRERERVGCQHVAKKYGVHEVKLKS